MIAGCHHVGLVVDDYVRTVEFYRDVLGGEVTTETDVDEKVRVAFVDLPDHAVEVIVREERGTELDDLLDVLRERSDYHVAYVVPDVEAAMVALEREGYRLFDETPVEGLGPYVRAFVHPADVPGIPVELVELDG
ncbi:hypothetical protein BRD00_07515 [Halobacteriales archaeon QS_8_69_26]|nr:MAG: hypothetical protein BRD00_07515 [Halobacteriales archaeon QS_8_69_26]